MNESVLCRVGDEGVAEVILSNPELHNAFDDVIVARLGEIFNGLDAREDVRVVVLRAEGKSFCAGGDLNWMRRMAAYSYEQNLADSRQLAGMLRALNTLSKPTIARVQGAAYGGGVGLVACCDIAVGTGRAGFCLSEVKVGMIPATISPYVIAAIGGRAARRYFTTAELISSERALDLGLLGEVFESEEEMDAGIDALVSQLLKNGPEAVSNAKALALDFSDLPISPELIEESSVRIARTRDSNEGREGLTAFLEKRKPAWIQ
jgi:methylglutaconyl-CoA hydratase